MTFRDLSRAAGLALLLVIGSTGPALAVAPPPAAVPGFPALKDFDARISAAKAAMMADPGVALARSNEAFAIAQQAPAGRDRTIASATAQWLQGEALVRINQPRKARPIIEQALAAVVQACPNTKLHGDLLMARGSALAVLGEVQSALAAYQQAYDIYRVANQPRGQAKALQNIGSIYQDAGDYPRVLTYYAQSAEVYAGDPALTVSARNNTGNAYKEQGRYREAEQEFHLALDAAKQMESPLLEARILTNLASTEILDGKLASADADVARGLRIADHDAAAREWRPFLWGVSAQAALRRGQPAQAAALVERTFAGQDLTATTLPYRDFHQIAYRAYAQLGQSRRALAHLEAFKRLDDAARSLAASTNGALMTARFDFANQALKIAQLKAGQLQRDAQEARERSRGFTTLMLVLLAAGTIVFTVLLLGFLSVRRSRNEAHQANDNLSKANLSLERALKARTDFLATTSHEIRTPLNGVLGMTQVILAQENLDPGLREKVELVHESGETMRLLVDDILDLAKIETGHIGIDPTEVDLRRVLQETNRFWSDQARIRGLEVQLDCQDCPERVVHDERRLRQILFNLMSNAIKFTLQGGTVTLAVSTEAAESGEQIVFTVSDTGIGIPADMLEEIFEPFRQVDGGTSRRFGGTGLGLAICRDLAKAMGGDISVTSAAGAGSTFTVRLPLVRPSDAQAAHAPADDGQRALGDCAVLLLEANPLSQSQLRAALSGQVGRLETAGSVSAAEEALSAKAFDIIVADQASIAADSEEVRAGVQALQAQGRGARVIVLTPDRRPASHAGLSAAGATQVLVKPCPAHTLVEALALAAALRPSDAGEHDLPTALSA